ncbi:uncharacterized protein LOC117650356 [Thrips palmi]|uniref:Uncharacterized protein LOC117650356 n=1 Tax=Thrips palmi TaxID=161013 RepID=A0A6P8ZW76_THRPL|nr:uncharacterized protein LOC117650356 [Thrips palmi]XP_034249618.1 uncharacterized protein LOC117650356 [Thrips palmi]
MDAHLRNATAVALKLDHVMRRMPQLLPCVRYAADYAHSVLAEEEVEREFGMCEVYVSHQDDGKTLREWLKFYVTELLESLTAAVDLAEKGTPSYERLFNLMDYIRILRSKIP